MDAIKGGWKRLLLVAVLLATGCASVAQIDFNSLFGTSSPQKRVENAQLNDQFIQQAEFVHTQVEPILNSRCVVCHACYDAPCQLKMTSSEGIERGASKEKVYQGTRLVAATPNRLLVDAFTPEAWRQRGFYPMLNERDQTPEANTQASVLARMLTLKQMHPLPEDKILDKRFDFSLDRVQQCASLEEMDKYEQSQPLAGMPYGLPALNANEHQVLMHWLEQGAPLPFAQALTPEFIAEITLWEKFLNGDSLKSQLSARYIYEHLFAFHLYFESLNQPNTQPLFFELVRSRTPPGQALDIIASRRPFDDPKVERVYYRFRPYRATIVDKTHIPYALNTGLLNNWQQWFIDADYSVTQLPSYKPSVAANPFEAFIQIPASARYRFMLTRAQDTIMGFIKGPVCRGQVALNVINDRFWVYFVTPDYMDDTDFSAFYHSQLENLRMPAEEESTALAVTWVKYAAKQGKYMRARNQFLNEKFKNGQHLTIDGLWDGDDTNDNASLTVFRHFDNATVVKGLVGEPPKTAWIIDYALLERIHYLLVAGFDVYGNYGHQLLTRLYMDFLRMEGESNFLTLLPQEERRKQLSDWYQGAGTQLTAFIAGDINTFHQPTGVLYFSDDLKGELYQKLGQKVAKVQPNRYHIENSSLQIHSKALLHTLDRLKGTQATLLPELTMIMVEPEKAGKTEIFTLVRNSAHRNISSLFNEASNREPAKDDVTLVHGLLGSYPEAFWRVKEQDLPNVVATIEKMQTEKDYEALLDMVGVRRTDPKFWAFSDKLNQIFFDNHPIESGWLDYNRLQNR
ncbi:MAG: fatty acid cis/trans isomerase [Shewanella sp.]|uniref:fatty acid cis/trans isomerase n=1 Tax=unclassified Shewanella TaxID=196818 RepID=UPI0021D9C09B|nr:MULTISPECIES: fatty acid cis/trans isomerase [unclassified Shewanella]MCU8036043.1 fatty acid cis/trans isomerase [Shewanella sp. SM71]MCU8097998.1 fatty acid cis/trans isomerase [Shewanella sp. SM102]